MAKYPYLSEKICKNCGGNILIKRSRDINKEFCGTGCVGKYLHMKEKQFTNCKYCGKEFIKTSKTKNLFCSKNCSNKSKIVEYKRVCERCGKEFISHNIAEINRGGNRFCSVKCSTRKYNFNENYFNEIDTGNKAYILGFLYADGCISKKKTEMIIKLQNKDKVLLESIKLEMESEHPVKDLTLKNRYQACFRISSMYMCEKLISHGVAPCKTFTIKFPELKKDLINHFIRGYFDGDGCIYKIKNRNSYAITIFTASKDFMESFKEIMLLNGIIISVYERDNGYAIFFSKKELVDKFYDFIYKDAGIYLERKKNKFPNT